jgi:hypothetical protein
LIDFAFYLAYFLGFQKFSLKYLLKFSQYYWIHRTTFLLVIP